MKLFLSFLVLLGLTLGLALVMDRLTLGTQWISGLIHLWLSAGLEQRTTVAGFIFTVIYIIYLAFRPKFKRIK